MRTTLFISGIVFACVCGKDRYPVGGYPYVETLVAADSDDYFRPVRSLLNRKDSFNYANYRFEYQHFGEPNISLRPARKPIYRLLYSGYRGEFVFVLDDHCLTFKKQTGTEEKIIPRADEVFSRKEELWYQTFSTHFPGESDTAKKVWRRFRYDSLLKRHPQLYDPVFYEKMVLKESAAYLRHPSALDVKTIDLPDSLYRRFIDSLNSSGFWTSPIDAGGKDIGFDGWAITMEANTADRYNVVMSDCWVCGSTGPIKAAFQQLIDATGLDSFIHINCLRSQAESNDTSAPKFVVQDVQLEDIKEPRVTRRQLRERAKRNAAEWAETLREDAIFDTIYALPEVQRKSDFIDSISHHQKYISIVFVRKPTGGDNDYLIQAGFSGPERFEPYFNFYVNKKSLAIRYCDPVTGLLRPR